MSHRFRSLIALLLVSLLMSPSAYAGGGPASGVHLSISPSCFAVGQKITLTITLTGVQLGEQVAFSNQSKKGAGGDLGLHWADATSAGSSSRWSGSRGPGES